jgi:hypothetical protein
MIADMGTRPGVCPEAEPALAPASDERMGMDRIITNGFPGAFSKTLADNENASTAKG